MWGQDLSLSLSPQEPMWLPGQQGSPLVKPGAMFSASGYFKFEAWPGVCPTLEPRCRIRAGCTEQGAVPVPGRPWPLVPVRWPHPRSALAPAAGSVMSRTGPCGAGGGHPHGSPAQVRGSAQSEV